MQNNISKNILLIVLLTIGVLALLYVVITNQQKTTEKPIVVVIPSYNNIKWYKKNLGMLVAQNKHHKNWRAIYINDSSTDGTGDAVETFIKENKLEHKITLINNKENLGAVANFYNAIHSCKDHEIVVVYDGDDWFKDDKVLSKINHVYQDNNIWLTYGQYEEFPSGKLGMCKDFPQEVIDQNAFRQYTWVSSHLRTFYAGLFKKIKKEDLSYKGKFYPMTGDLAAMFPMLEMAGKHIKFIPQILYVHNDDNPINDWKKDLNLVLYLDKHIRNQIPYQRLHNPSFITN